MKLFANFLNLVGLLVTCLILCQFFDLRTHRGALDFPDQVNAYLSKELKLGRISGPFDTVPLAQGFVVSPLNTVEKRDSEEAIEMRKQMTDLLRRGGFRPHKWLTNDPDVMATIPEQDRSPRFLELREDMLSTDRTLGVIWDAQEDMLQSTGLKDEPGTTKRKILSQAFSVWDPRGLLLPFLIEVKSSS